MGRDAVVVDHRDVQAREVLRLESDGVLVVLAPPGVVRLHALQPLPRSSESFSYLRLLGPALSTTTTHGRFNSCQSIQQVMHNLAQVSFNKLLTCGFEMMWRRLSAF